MKSTFCLHYFQDDESNANSAPPSDMDLSRNSSTANFENGGAPPPPSFGPPGGGSSLAPPPGPPAGGNKYIGGLSKKRSRGFVDVFKNSQSSPALSNNNALPAPNELFMPPPMAAPMTAPMSEPSAPTPMGEPNPPAMGDAANGMNSGNGNPSPDAAPAMFFNPNQYSVAAPTTRRNKY